ncbi:hypothetical protein BDY19DRAFT_886087 [Irpex rosettiformis]|uniref:Uncharacterized protein n=1 Tax=Irpex rosettiformis TaxID=378272 RepID=A0ACB8UAG1_9APHY|nr:hypothetical protein BDY19DRAFT_886087 [Irpex rosettiformis]
MTASDPIDILILGAGWTSTFLIPLLTSHSLTYAATSRPSHPKPHTIPFEYDQNNSDPSEEDEAQFSNLPDARTVLVTFPISVKGASERLVRLYEKTRTGRYGNEFEGGKGKARWIQLGTTSVWDVSVGRPFRPPSSDGSVLWSDRYTPIDMSHPRGAAEKELLALSPDTQTTVLNLSGLWGGQRAMKHYIGRVAPTKEALKNKGSVHMIHGIDVCRAILAVHSDFDKAVGQRWLLTDGRVYDWWDLAHAWGPHPRWVQELMLEHGVRALPRSVELLGKALDSQDFWNTFGIQPIEGRLE